VQQARLSKHISLAVSTSHHQTETGMSEDNAMNQPINDAQRYLMRVHRHLSPDWAAYFAQFEIKLEPGGITLFIGTLRDQSDMQSFLIQLLNLGLTLLEMRAYNVVPGHLEYHQSPHTQPIVH
jgi:hypothetical protein